MSPDSGTHLPLTSSPLGAMAHARSMGDTRVEAMPVVPARDAVGLPDGVRREAAVWEETIAGGGYASRELARGSRLRLTDLRGDGCVSLLVFNAARTVERLNIADTVKVQWNAYLGPGRLLLSDMGRVLLSILEDECGTHDAFCGASNEASNARRYGDGVNYGTQPNARDRFKIALAKYGLGRKDIHPCLNLFKGVKISPNGRTELDYGPFPAGRSLTLRAEMDVLLVMANCPHVLDPRPDYRVTPVRATAWKGPVTAEDDPVRLATPEALRAFLNVEDYYLR